MAAASLPRLGDTAAELWCGACGEKRLVQVKIKTSPADEPQPGVLAMKIEVEISERDRDVAATFGRVHLDPHAAVIAR